MIGILWALALLFTTETVSEHDAMIAVFKVSQEGQEIQLEVNFDIEDYHTINNLSADEVNASQLTQYLNKTTNWTFNGEALADKIMVTDLVAQGEHYHAICRVGSMESNISEISIKNEFLLPLEGHSNIIMIDLNGKSRDFRMHAERKSIEFTY